MGIAATGRKYDLYGPEFRADPHSVFARIREEEPRDQLEWRPTPGFRRLVALPVAW